MLYLSRVSLMYDYVTILGDFNLDLLNDSNGTVNQFLTLIESYNFTQIINEPSRVTAATATLLDLILVSDVDRVRSHSVKPTYGLSDHDAVECIIDFTTTTVYRIMMRWNVLLILLLPQRLETTKTLI
ncbi:Endonuclease-reverse transcriptase [Popillia japonica]|uniref:Endonuclease-reverse transcriptase n=1 Tax=Popillia japonica TaxID=7064 RepID=A0AAW1MEP7_POPJA